MLKTNSPLSFKFILKWFLTHHIQNLIKFSSKLLEKWSICNFRLKWRVHSRNHSVISKNIKFNTFIDIILRVKSFSITHSPNRCPQSLQKAQFLIITVIKMRKPPRLFLSFTLPTWIIIIISFLYTRIMYVTYICLLISGWHIALKKSCCSHIAKGDGIERNERTEKMEKLFFMIFLTLIIFFSFFVMCHNIYRKDWNESIYCLTHILKHFSFLSCFFLPFSSS